MIADGASVRVFNERGQFTVLAKSCSPGVLSSLGGWRRHSLAGAPLATVSSTGFADLGNAPTLSDTLVEVALA